MYKVLITFLFVLIIIPIQAQYRGLNNHFRDSKIIEPTVSIGENNIGAGLFIGYFLSEKILIRAGGMFRDFKYKTYSENILEFSLDGNYTVLQPSYSSRLFRNFSINLQLGAAAEIVKTTSETTLIDPYPNYYYVYGGLQLEYTLTRNLALTGHFRQFYAINGSETQLGNYRYDYGASIRYYLYR